MILQPPSVLLLGQTGAGKTDSLLTYIEAGLELFVVVTEGSGVDTLLDSCARRKLDVNKLHWTTCVPADVDWSALTAMTDTIGAKSFEEIQSIKSGVGKDKTREPAMKMLKAFQNFTCERDGRSYGDITKWSDDRALALDSLSGLSLISMALTIGFKPAAHQGEWGVAMNYIEQVVLKLTNARQYHFCLTSHVEKEMNELSATNEIMVSTLGKKLAPKLPRFFSEMVYAARDIDDKTKQAQFRWSTLERQISLKNRALGVGSNLKPSFLPIVRAYETRLGIAAAEPQAAGTQTASPAQTPKPVLPAAATVQRTTPPVAGVTQTKGS